LRSRSFKRQRGAEILEFVITLPAILTVFFLIVELGVGFVDQAVLVNASRAAAREVIRGRTDTQAREAAEQVLASLISWDPEAPAPTVNVMRSGANAGDEVAVTVTYTYQFLLLPAFASTAADLTLSARTVMRMLPV
jgi:Flp pilus assembly protein TadG